MTTVIDALKRLERAGSQVSPTSEKLRQAAVDLAGHLATIIPEDAGEINPLGCGVSVSHAGITVWGDGDQGTRVRPGYVCPLELARDIATAVSEGWLAWVADEIEARTADNERLTEVLAATIAKLRS